jgi:hypothetical protein
MVWIVINATNISNTLNSLIDKGNFKDSQNIKYYLDNFLKKLKSVCQSHGGSVHLMLYERIILEVSLEVAEQIPNIIEIEEVWKKRNVISEDLETATLLTICGLLGVKSAITPSLFCTFVILFDMASNEEIKKLIFFKKFRKLYLYNNVYQIQQKFGR